MILETTIPASRTETNGHVQGDHLWVLEQPAHHYAAVVDSDHESRLTIEADRFSADNPQGWAMMGVVGPFRIYVRRDGVPVTVLIR